MADCTLVTGGSRNIGRAICERLSADGQTVVQFDVIEPAGEGAAEFVRVDLSDAEAAEAALSALRARHRIVRLVNNVGVVSMAPVAETSMAEFDRVLAINSRIALQCARAAAPDMKAAGFGRIVNIASRAIAGIPGLSVYAASKAAVVGLAKTWAMELARDGVTANAIAPGPIDTDMLRAAWEPDSAMFQSLHEQVPVGRLGQPEDIANAASFLLDARSGFVTGQVLHVCGGMSIGRAA